jgi:IS30 family transposase
MSLNFTFFFSQKIYDDFLATKIKKLNQDENLKTTIHKKTNDLEINQQITNLKKKPVQIIAIHYITIYRLHNNQIPTTDLHNFEKVSTQKKKSFG